MAKIIPFKKPKERKVSGPTVQFEDGAGNDLGIATINLEPTLKIKLFLNNLKGSVSMESTIAGWNALEGFTSAELLRIAAESTESDWSKRPGYFYALIERIILQTIKQNRRP